MFPYFLLVVLAFPCSIHWLHLFNNSTMNFERSVVSFTSKVNNLQSTRGNVSWILFISWAMVWSWELGLTSHLFILRRSIWLISWMVVIVSSLLFLELCWFISISFFPKAFQILLPSNSISFLSNDDNAFGQASFTSLANHFLSMKFVSQTFMAISSHNCSEGESIGKSETLYLWTNMVASWNLSRAERDSLYLTQIPFRERSSTREHFLDSINLQKRVLLENLQLLIYFSCLSLEGRDIYRGTFG